MCSELKKKQGVRAGGSDRTLDSSIAREDLRSKPVPVWKGRLEISVVVGPTATRPGHTAQGTLWNTLLYFYGRVGSLLSIPDNAQST